MNETLKAKIATHDARFNEATYGGSSASAQQADDHSLIHELAGAVDAAEAKAAKAAKAASVSDAPAAPAPTPPPAS